MMFGRVVKNIIRKELLGNGRVRSEKFIVRAILTSETKFHKHNLTDGEKDVIVYSPLPSLTYPDWTIDQYVWNDLNKWTSKPALVRIENYHL